MSHWSGTGRSFRGREGRSRRRAVVPTSACIDLPIRNTQVYRCAAVATRATLARMTLRLPTLFTATAVLICSLLTVARPVDAAIITLQFDGTVDVSHGVVFGEDGDAVPFTFSLTYDTSLGSNTAFHAAGSTLEGWTLAHDFFGYSRAGIADMSFAFEPPNSRFHSEWLSTAGGVPAGRSSSGSSVRPICGRAPSMGK